MSKRRKIVFILTGLLLIIGFSCITTIDFSPLEEQNYYRQSKINLNRVNLQNKDTSWVEAGWSKKNITPSFPAKIVGFGKNTNFSGVIDSLYVRSIVFRQNQKKYLYLSYDLMIIHPYLVGEIEKGLKKAGLHFEGIYYTATHTHNGIGGFADKLSGMIALGGKNQKVITLLIKQTIASCKKSTANLSHISYCYNNNEAKELIKNRLDHEFGSVYSKLHVIQLKNKEGKQLALFNFSAHATSLSRKLDSLSTDYPGRFINRVEETSAIDFAIFSAGSVGSHATTNDVLTNKSMNIYAERLLWKTHKPLSNCTYKPLKNICFQNTLLPLRSPHLKIWKNFILRPWIFELIMGEGQGKLSFLKLGNLVLIGTPCDFSGEITLEIENQLTDKNIIPIITSFNGEYIGYITLDKYYMRDTHEVRDVNWFGPYNGRYFRESILHVLNNIKE